MCSSDLAALNNDCDDDHHHQDEGRRHTESSGVVLRRGNLRRHDDDYLEATGVIAFSSLRNANASRRIFTMTEGLESVDTPRVRGK